MIKCVYLSGLQLDNLYRLDVVRYAKENPIKIKFFTDLNQLEKTNRNLIGSGMYVVI